MLLASFSNLRFRKRAAKSCFKKTQFPGKIWACRQETSDICLTNADQCAVNLLAGNMASAPSAMVVGAGGHSYLQRPATTHYKNNKKISQ